MVDTSGKKEKTKQRTVKSNEQVIEVDDMSKDVSYTELEWDA